MTSTDLHRLTFLFAAVAALSGCGGGGDDAPATSTSSAAPAPSPTPAPAPAPGPAPAPSPAPSPTPSPAPSPAPAGACGKLKELTLAALSGYEGSYAVRVFDAGATAQGPATLLLSGGQLQFTPGAGLAGSSAATLAVNAVCENTDAAGRPIGVVAVIDADRHVDFFAPAFGGLYVSGSDLGSAAAGGRYLQGDSPRAAAGPAPAPVPAPGPAPNPAPTPAGGDACTPLVAKAGDSLSYRQTSSAAGSAPYTVRYDFGAGSYKGSPAVVATISVSGASAAQAGVGSALYLDPVTGAVLGEDAAAGSAADTSTQYDPPDWAQRLAGAGLVNGASGRISVTATLRGKSISDAFAALGGATAVVMKYEFQVRRDPNETLVTAAGSFADSCKFRVEFALQDFQVQGPAASSPLLATMLPLLQSSFAAPTQVTLWSSQALPFMLPKTVTQMSLPAPTGAVTSTQELIAYTRAPR